MDILKIGGVVKALRKDQKGLLLDDDNWYSGFHSLTCNKGDEVEIEFVLNGEYRNIEQLKIAKMATDQPEQSGFFKDKTGDDMLNLDKLLAQAHKLFSDGIFKIETEVQYADYEKKMAVFKAVVTTNLGVFTGHGDADQVNCGNMVKEHYVRMAETRAICRALRWATNNATAAQEEMNSSQPETEENKD